MQSNKMYSTPPPPTPLPTRPQSLTSGTDLTVHCKQRKEWYNLWSACVSTRVCIYVCLVCLYVWLSVCLFVSQFFCLYVCLSACLSVCLSVCPCVHMQSLQPKQISKFWRSDRSLLFYLFLLVWNLQINEDLADIFTFIQSYHWLNVLWSFGYENTGLSFCLCVCRR